MLFCYCLILYKQDKNDPTVELLVSEYTVSENKKMKVIYVGSPPVFTKGASAIHVLKMCQAMARLDLDTELIISCGKNRRELLDYYNVEDSFRVTPFPYFNNSSLRNITHGILCAFYVKFFRANRYDIVVTRNIVFTYIATKFFGIPTVYDAHHPLVTGADFLFNSFKDSEHLVRFSTNSKGLSEIYLEDGLPKDKLVVAHNGVELERFEEGPSMNVCRKELGLPLGKKIVCYSGNIYEGRGIESLIDVAQKLNDVMFLIVGGLEEDVDKYRRICDQKGVQNFKLIGFVQHKDVPLYLLASDVLVMPYTSKMTIKGGTRAEEFTSPIKLFEYMAANRPIVATSIPSVSEVLQDEKNSVLVDPDNTDALYDGINRVINDDKLATRIAAKAASDCKSYTWEARCRKLLNLE